MKNNADLFDHVQSRIRKPDLPFAMQDKSKANEESIFHHESASDRWRRKV